MSQSVHYSESLLWAYRLLRRRGHATLTDRNTLSQNANAQTHVTKKTVSRTMSSPRPWLQFNP